MKRIAWIFIILIWVASCKPPKNQAQEATKQQVSPPPPAPMMDEDQNASIKETPVKARPPKTSAKPSARGADREKRESSTRSGGVESVETITIEPVKDVPLKPAARKARKSLTIIYEEGKLVYDIPDTMMVDVTSVVTVRINRNVADNSILVGIKPVIDTIIRVAEVMDVRVVDPCGSCFRIEKSNDEQIVEREGYTEWVFGVTPLKTGKSYLNIIVSVITDGKRKQQVYSDSVLVKTTPAKIVKSWWDKYWQWTFSTLLIPLTIWFFNRKKKQKKNESN